MLSQAQRSAILELSGKGVSRREIARVLQVSRLPGRPTSLQTASRCARRSSNPWREGPLLLVCRAKDDGEVDWRMPEMLESRAGCIGRRRAVVSWSAARVFTNGVDHKKGRDYQHLARPRPGVWDGDPAPCGKRDLH